MSNAQELKHLQKIIQLTEYVAAMSRYGRDLNTDDFRSNPIPLVDDYQPTRESLEKRLKDIISGIYQDKSEEKITESTKVKSEPLRPSKGAKDQNNQSRSAAGEGSVISAAQTSKNAPRQLNQLPGDFRELYRLVERVRDSDDRLLSVLHLPMSHFIPNYEEMVPYPMSFSLIYSRLYQNAHEGRFPAVAPSGEPNLLVYINYKRCYGAVSDFYHRQPAGFFDRHSEELRRDAYQAMEAVRRACKGDVPPYDYVAEVVRDLFLLAFNVWFWNYTAPDWVGTAINLMAKTRMLFVQRYSELVCPRWTHCLDGAQELHTSQMKDLLLRAQEHMRAARDGRAKDVNEYRNYMADTTRAQGTKAASASLSKAELLKKAKSLQDQLSQAQLVALDEAVVKITSGDDWENLDAKALTALCKVLEDS